jgi:predicted dehydrogenase
MIRVAFLSTAHIHAKAFLEEIAQGDGECVVHVIWDEDRARGERYAAQFGTRFEGELANVVQDAAVDGFVICAENTRHLPLLRTVLPAGKPVFCEKPLVTSSSDLQALRALVARYRTPLFSGYFYPFEPALRTVRAMLERDEFGVVTRVRFRNSHSGTYGRWFDSPELAWFHDPALAGGGAFMDVGSHAVHALRTLLGPVATVWALVGNQSGVYATCDDFGIAQLRFDSGVIGTVEASWTQTGGPNGLEIAGSKQTLWVTTDGYLTARLGEAPRPLAITENAQPIRVARLAAVIRGEIKPPALEEDLAAALDTVAIVEACYRSAKSERWEQVELSAQ